MHTSIDNILKAELLLMGFNCNNLNFKKIRSKDGVFVYRVIIDNHSYVIKYFSNRIFKREIHNYHVLNSIGVPTMNVISHTKNSILLEDIRNSEVYRLGIIQDLEDETSARLIAKWYKTLHSKGENVIGLSNLYSETDIIQKESIDMLKKKSYTENYQIWSLILENFDTLKRLISQCKQTLTYNDFYWTNLIVAKNMSSAIIFDYNLLGRGYRYSDIRNVCSSLSENAETAFLEEYGRFNQREKIIDDGISILVNLLNAFQKEKFPKWGYDSLERLKNGDFFERVIRILEL